MNKYLLIFVCTFMGFVAGTYSCDIHGTPTLPVGSVKDSTAAGMHIHQSLYDEDNGDFRSLSVQAIVAGRFSSVWGWQLAVPYVDRELGEDSESGLGDATALLFYRLWEKRGDAPALLDLYAGVKLPTGDSDRLAEESMGHHHAANGGSSDMHSGISGRLVGHAGHEHHGQSHSDKHGSAETSAGASDVGHTHHSGGHHVAPGSGSWDGVLGLRGLWRQGSWGFFADGQYNLRTEGDHDFKFGDEIIARIAGGYYFTDAIWAGLELSGEWRAENEIRGEKVSGSDKSSSYVAPATQITLGERFSLNAALDLPLSDRDKGLAGSADQRIRLSAVYLF